MKDLPPTDPFADPALVARYVEDTPKRVPGFADLHRMTLILLSEAAPQDARILVVGAGGGLELRAFAELRPAWSFVGVDPSASMLDLARDIVQPFQSQVELISGYVDDAPEGPFDGATCLLTLHFLTRSERLRLLQAVRRRLKPGAPLVVAHHTNPEVGKAERWLARSAAFSMGPQVDLAQAATSAAGMAQRLPLLSIRDEEALLREAGFSDIALFYAGFSFRGWVAIAREERPT